MGGPMRGIVAAAALFTIVSVCQAETAGITDGCQYRKAMNCLTDLATLRSAKVATTAKKKQELKQSFIDEVCQHGEKKCEAEQLVQDCAHTQRLTVNRTVAAFSGAVDVLCEDNASLLKNLSWTFHCWDFLKMRNCLYPGGLVNAAAIFGSKRTHEQCRTVSLRMSQCVDTTLGDLELCGETPDIEGARSVVLTVFSNLDCTRQKNGAKKVASVQGPYDILSLALTTVLITRLL
ncbi:uncharacterized protein LOC144173123 [Haemaphysalis longicornis]